MPGVARVIPYSDTVWRLENTAELTPLGPDDGQDPAAESPGAAPERVALGEPGLQLVDVAEPQRRLWREELARLGGENPLLRFDDSPRTRIELSSTHPGGLARLIAGKRTRLSSLIRESFAWRTAHQAAEAIVAKGAELQATRGIDAIRLGIVLAEWEVADERFVAPVLLRPVAMRRVGDDYELVLRGRTVLNPALASALAQQFGIVLDAESFVALAQSGGTFTPNAVLDRLRGLTAHLSGFRVSARLLVSTFADVASDMAADATTLAHPLLDAVAGNETALETIRESFKPAAPIPSDDRSPQTDSLILDADEEQERIVAQIVAGNSIVVRTLPGTGGTQTIVNAIGGLVAEDKRVLVVGARRASLRAIRERLESVGLTGLAASPRTARRDAVLAITRSEKATRPDLTEVDDALVRLRQVIRDYREALTRRDPVLGVTVLDCVSQLSRLAVETPEAETTARLSRGTVEALSDREERDRTASVMVAAARFGEFKHAPGESPWFGAQFPTADAANRAHALAVRLHTQTLPALIERGNALIAGTHMRPFTSVAELGVYLRLLLELRDTLDRFQPAVFDRSISELIAATAPKREHPELSGSDRRRLRKLAEEYLRPGVRVPDLHEALVRIQRQRILWHRYVAEGATPRVPVGIAEVQVALQSVEHDLAELDAPFGRVDAARLAVLPLDELQRIVAGLSEESESLQHLQERSALMSTLHQLGLDPLIADLAARRVPPERMRAELELAWWKSALAGLLEADRALLGAKTDVLDRLEADFRLVDEAHARGNATALAWRLAERWAMGLVDWPEEAQALKRVLRREHVTSYDLHIAAPHLTKALNPVWIASPYEVPQIFETIPFDAVILVDAGATTIGENALAIRRARQVVAFGDPVTQTPTPFEIAIRDRRGASDSPADAADLHEDSALAVLGRVLPSFTLTRSYRASGEDLVELVNRRFYGGRITALPWAGTFLGESTLSVEYLEVRGMLADSRAAVESPDAEVERVVQLVLEHAATRPAESLMVVTSSRRHAPRVMSAVLAAFAKRPDLVGFIAGESAEPFEVLTLDQAVATSRDRVIFSLGFGRTPHGRVLSEFGLLSAPGGDRLFAAALTAARRGLTILTAVTPEDIDEDRASDGLVAFKSVLEDIAGREIPADGDRGGTDPMVEDLAERLRERGIRARLGYRGVFPLVAGYERRSAVIEMDADLLASSLRESLRLRPEALKRLGWQYVRVHAFELFQEPDLVADRIAELLGAPPLPAAEPEAQGDDPAVAIEAGRVEPVAVEPASPASEAVEDDELEATLLVRDRRAADAVDTAALDLSALGDWDGESAEDPSGR